MLIILDELRLIAQINYYKSLRGIAQRNEKLKETAISTLEWILFLAHPTVLGPVLSKELITRELQYCEGEAVAHEYLNEIEELDHVEEKIKQIKWALETVCHKTHDQEVSTPEKYSIVTPSSELPFPDFLN